MPKRPAEQQDRTIEIACVRVATWMVIARACDDQSVGCDDHLRDWLREVAKHIRQRCAKLPPTAYATLMPKVSTVYLLARVIANIKSPTADVCAAGCVLTTCAWEPRQRAAPTVTAEDVELALEAEREMEGIRTIPIYSEGA